MCRTHTCARTRARTCESGGNHRHHRHQNDVSPYPERAALWWRCRNRSPPSRSIATKNGSAVPTRRWNQTQPDTPRAMPVRNGHERRVARGHLPPGRHGSRLVPLARPPGVCGRRRHFGARVPTAGSGVLRVAPKPHGPARRRGGLRECRAAEPRAVRTVAVASAGCVPQRRPRRGLGPRVRGNGMVRRATLSSRPSRDAPRARRGAHRSRELPGSAQARRGVQNLPAETHEGRVGPCPSDAHVLPRPPPSALARLLSSPSVSPGGRDT